ARWTGLRSSRPVRVTRGRGFTSSPKTAGRSTTWRRRAKRTWPAWRRWPIRHSTRRPSEVAAAQEVHVQVGHGLAGALQAVNHHPVAVGQSKIPRQPGGDDVQMADERLVRLGQVGVGRNLLSRDDEYVGRGLRVDVAEGHALFVFVNDVG